MKLCVAYCRVSTNKEDQKNSLQAQKDYYTKLFSQEGYNPANVGMLYKRKGKIEKLSGIFADEGISGTSTKNRQAFITMMEYARKRAFDVIYVKSASRFSRDLSGGVSALRELRDLGIQVIFGDCLVNTLDTGEDIQTELSFLLANHESKQKSINTKWGMMRLFEKGGWNGAPPYGYNCKDSYLEINEAEAEVVKQVYSLFVNDGNGIGKITRYLNENKIPTRNGVQWSQPQVSRILDNQIYIGLQICHITQTIDVNTKSKAIIPDDEQIKHHFEHLRIIPDDLYKLAELERNKRNSLYSYGRKPSDKHLLSTLLYCGCCGGSYKRKKRNAYKRKDGTAKELGYEWTCAVNDMYGKSKCDTRVAVNEDEIIEQIKHEITELKTRDMDGLFELYLTVKFHTDISQSRLDELQRQKAKVDKKISNLRDDLADDIISRDEYKDQVKGLLDESRGITADIERIQRHDIEVETAKLKYREFIDYVKKVDVNNLTNAELKKIFKNIRLKRVGTTGKMISYNYYCMDMGIDDIIDKAGELGYKIAVKRVI